MQHRCNNKFDCSDKSDEKNCKQLTIDDDFRKISPPPVRKSGKTNITLSLKVKYITNIDELAMTFDTDLLFYLQWRDQRLKFNNLKANGNILNTLWQNQIWLPPLYFSNTKGNMPILAAYSVALEILRHGKPVKNDVSQLNEGNIFSGDENDLYLVAKINPSFHCFFELSRFPFDTQHCYITIKIPIEIQNETTLIPKQIIYTGVFRAQLQ